MPVREANVLSGAPLLGDWIVQHRPHAFLTGPDGEPAQRVAQAATRHGFDHAVCQKLRHGDKSVNTVLPPVSVQGRAVVLLDDVASSGHTMARAAQLLRAVGAVSVDVAVTYAFFAGDALQVIRDAGVAAVWSTDCIAHPSNTVSMAQALHRLWDEAAVPHT